MDFLPRNPMRVHQNPFIFQDPQSIPCPRLAFVQPFSREEPLWPIELFLRRGQGSTDAVDAVEIPGFNRPKQCLPEEVVFIPNITKVVRHALGDAALDLVEEAPWFRIGRGSMECRVFN
ncbi:uncharacterized protein B0H64DRAFT_402567 [Chaetomium fimeti]|uniref:Uncharacterized protein n=1 Tax=Chaetomium fimeti TaxID=1854472 RepID=A0AAE0HF09_9PEZI|nr:hypothetical protein B0H64DRAFT_402567 [Chaetomium fimeti]